jgi:hypothetical protein
MALFFIAIDYILIFLFCSIGWLLNRIFLDDTYNIQIFIAITWYLTLIIIRYYFKIKPLKFKFFQLFIEKTIGLKREDLFS